MVLKRDRCLCSDDTSKMQAVEPSEVVGAKKPIINDFQEVESNIKDI